jgi:hypothetical protein
MRFRDIRFPRSRSLVTPGRWNFLQSHPFLLDGVRDQQGGPSEVVHADCPHEPGSKRESPMRLAYLMISAGVCAIPLCAWAVASIYAGSVASISEPQSAAPVVVERAHKSDRLVHPFNVGGAEMPVISVDVAGRLDAAITVRAGDGRMLYQVDPENHTTVIAKRMMERTRPAPAPPHDTALPGKPVLSSPPDRELPDGCEGAFSPYAAPSMARVIGRCVSGLAENVWMA